MLVLISYRKKGINAYLAPVYGTKIETNKCMFGVPKTEQDKQLAYRSKAHQVEIDISGLLGWYKYVEASQARRIEGFLRIENGEIKEELGSFAEYLNKKTEHVELSSLVGSDKQIQWADAIRRKIVVELLTHVYDSLPQSILNKINAYSAKEWIDQREVINYQSFLEDDQIQAIHDDI